MMRDVRALSNRSCERIVLERAEDADLEQVRCGLCAQRVSKPSDTNNPRKGHISGVKLRRAHRLEVWVPGKRFALAISI